jgi:hypothetical protein
LSTGKPANAPLGDWFPDVPIKTDPKTFPFYALLRRPELRTNPRFCIQVSAAQ